MSRYKVQEVRESEAPNKIATGFALLPTSGFDYKPSESPIVFFNLIDKLAKQNRCSEF